ncbi:MAG: TetR/AcrR family transcriptional regulator [Myxococcales bacterium]|nr:TetR/AcrR family transcriptional regulator [Myxococcales bacterium]
MSSPKSKARRPPPTRRERKAETRSALLVAGRKLFSEAGYEGTTLAQVARRAGVAVGTVYVHFPDKATLLSHALHDDLERVLSEARQSLPRGKARTKLLHLARALFSYYAVDLPLSRILVKESLLGRLDPDTQPGAVLHGFLAEVAGILQRSKSLAPGVEPLVGAHAFFGLYLTVLLTGLREDEFDVEARIAQLDALLSTLFHTPSKS